MRWLSLRMASGTRHENDRLAVSPLNSSGKTADSYSMRKLLIVAALVGFTILSIPGTAGAACTPPDLESGMRRANVVFIGTVESVSNGDRNAVFDVHWVWRGRDVPEVVTVYGEASTPGDDRTFQTGITYIVATSTSVDPYRSDRCTGTRVWREAGNGGVIPSSYAAIFADTTPKSPIPVTNPSDSSSLLDNPLVPIGAGVFIAVLLIFAIGRVFRGPEQVTGPGARSGKRRTHSSRLPSVGRVGEGRMSGGLRRSGVSQAQKLRTKRKSSRKRSRKSRSKASKGGLRTDRIASSGSDADTTE